MYIVEFYLTKNQNFLDVPCIRTKLTGTVFYIIWNYIIIKLAISTIIIYGIYSSIKLTKVASTNVGGISVNPTAPRIQWSAFLCSSLSNFFGLEKTNRESKVLTSSPYWLATMKKTSRNFYIGKYRLSYLDNVRSKVAHNRCWSKSKINIGTKEWSDQWKHFLEQFHHFTSWENTTRINLRTLW